MWREEREGREGREHTQHTTLTVTLAVACRDQIMSALSSLTAAMSATTLTKKVPAATVVFSDSDRDDGEEEHKGDRSIRELADELSDIEHTLVAIMSYEGDEEDTPTSEDITLLLAPMEALRTTIEAACVKYKVVIPSSNKGSRKVRFTPAPCSRRCCCCCVVVLLLTFFSLLLLLLLL